MNWNVSPKDAISVQKELRTKVRIEAYQGDISDIKYIAGADVSLNRFASDIFAGIVVFSYPDFEIVERSLVKSRTDFPYIPGLLSFREVPALMECWEKLKIKPDILIVDGQGIAHPRRLGIATHIGILLDTPTIGCAKSVLTGVYEEPNMQQGSYTYLHDRYNGEVIGAVVRSKHKTKPLIISPGHKITLSESIDIILRSGRGYRLPEPTRLAHETVNMFRRGELDV